MSPREYLPDTIELRADAVTRETIDVNDGIERVMGNRELYARMLRRFRNDYQHGALPIRSALSDTDADTVLAHRLVHTLMGAAGMVGAHRLHERAGTLEEALRTNAGNRREALASLTTELDKVMHLLEILLDGSPPAGMPVHLPARPLLGDTALLDRLVELLSDGDGAAVDLLAEAAASLKVILGESKLARVTAAVNRFDFEMALGALAETDHGQGI
jgi:HPt (histidine-containing phosphotransfer) domain-containing protein